jgi:hypothetical protein
MGYQCERQPLSIEEVDRCRFAAMTTEDGIRF